MLLNKKKQTQSSLSYLIILASLIIAIIAIAEYISIKRYSMLDHSGDKIKVGMFSFNDHIGKN